MPDRFYPRNAVFPGKQAFWRNISFRMAVFARRRYNKVYETKQLCRALAGGANAA